MGTSHRTIETKVFYFDQLSDEAKEKARDWWRQCESEDPAWEAERRQTLEAFCKRFPVEARNWEYDCSGFRMSKIWNADRDSGEIHGSRLIALMLNWFGPLVLWEPKAYEKNGKKRHSKVLMVERSCPFTGYYLDDVMLDPIRAYLKKPDMEKTYKDLMAECLDAWGKACVDDVADSLKDEQVDDAIISNEYEFDEEGGRV